MESSLSVKDALVWIKTILEQDRVRYQIVGGMAARIHGARRPIIDIDMYIPAGDAQAVYSRVQQYVTKPLKHYVEDAWDIQYFQLIYKNQKIEIGLSPGARFLNKKTNEWVAQTIDFTKSVLGYFDGVQIAVMPRDELVAYKGLLDREVDRMDIEEMVGTE